MDMLNNLISLLNNVYMNRNISFCEKSYLTKYIQRHLRLDLCFENYLKLNYGFLINVLFFLV